MGLQIKVRRDPQDEFANDDDSNWPSSRIFSHLLTAFPYESLWTYTLTLFMCKVGKYVVLKHLFLLI